MNTTKANMSELVVISSCMTSISRGKDGLAMFGTTHGNYSIELILIYFWLILFVLWNEM